MLQQTKRIYLATLLVILSQTAQANTLDVLQAWQGAQQHDKQLAAAKAEHAAALTRKDQARAMWKPMLMAHATVGTGTSKTKMTGAEFSAPGMGLISQAEFSTVVRRATMNQAGISIQQPLIDGVRLANSKKMRIAAQLGELAYTNAHSQAMLNTVQHYFNLALAQEKKRILQRQIKAVERTVAEAQERFHLGEVTVTDTHEAKAALSGLRAMQIGQDIDLIQKRQIVQDNTGVAQPNALLPTNLLADTSKFAPYNTLPAWLDAVTKRNVQYQMAQHAVDVAKQDVRKSNPLSHINLSLVGQATRQRMWGRANVGRASNSNTNYMVGMRLTIPLYMGGMLSAQHKEAAHTQEKAHVQSQHSYEVIMQQARMLWAAQAASHAQVQALQQAAKASHARLNATRLGRALGDRTTLDVLNAENQYATAQYSVAKAIVEGLLNQLRMAAMVNDLDISVLEKVNHTLKAHTKQDTIQ